jgi:hypothetical protein
LILDLFTVSLDLCTDVQLVVLFTDSKSTMGESSTVAALGAELATWAITRLGRLGIEDIRAAHVGVAALADCLPFFSPACTLYQRCEICSCTDLSRTSQICGQDPFRRETGQNM